MNWHCISQKKIIKLKILEQIHCKVLTGSSREKHTFPFWKDYTHYFIHGGTVKASHQASNYQPEDMDHISCISPLIR